MPARSPCRPSAGLAPTCARACAARSGGAWGAEVGRVELLEEPEPAQNRAVDVVGREDAAEALAEQTDAALVSIESATMGCSPATDSRRAAELGPSCSSAPRNAAAGLRPSLTSRPRSSISPWPLGTKSRRLRRVAGSCLAVGRSSSSAGCNGCASERTSASALPSPSSVRGSSRMLAAISASRPAVVCSVRRPAVITSRKPHHDLRAS